MTFADAGYPDSVLITDTMSEVEFLKKLQSLFAMEYPSEDDHLAELCRRAAEEGVLECRKCGNRELESCRDRRLIRCPKCGGKTWFTARTYFHRIKLPGVWLFAIWLLDHGVVFSASAFQKVVQIAYSSAVNIFKKLTFIMQEKMESEKSVSSSHFSSLICKRSILTPAGRHPREEELQPAANANELDVENNRDDRRIGSERHSTESTPDSNSDANTDATVNTNTNTNPSDCKTDELQGVRKEIYDLLSDTPTPFEVVCDRIGILASDVSSELLMLELSDLVVKVGVNGFARKPATSASASCEEGLIEEVGDLVKFLRQKFHGVSLKYLQSYIAAYWSYADRFRWRNGALLKACMRSRAVTDPEVYAQLSPAVYRLPLIQTAGPDCSGNVANVADPAHVAHAELVLAASGEPDSS